MPRSLNLMLIALPCAVCALFLTAAEQPDTPKCDPSGVCTDGAAPAAAAGGKHIWAHSRIYTDAPPLEVQKWLTDKPEMEGKFLVIEFWRTWCGACKRTTPLMNTLQAKYGKELAVIGITGESEEKVKAYNGPKMEYFLALDLPRTDKDMAEAQNRHPVNKEDPGAAATEPDQAAAASAERPGQGHYEAGFGVWGWPHVIILEPQYHTIIWEGFPGLKGYELTEAKVEKILAIGRTKKDDPAAEKK